MAPHTSRLSSSRGPAVNSSPLSRPSFLAGFILGLKGYVRVPATLQRYGLWHYLLAPALVSLVLSFAILAVVILTATGLSWLVDRLVDVSIGWLDELINWMVGILMAFVMPRTVSSASRAKSGASTISTMRL